MATYTVDTSNAEEKSLAYVVAERNKQRAAQNPPLAPLSNAEYIDQILVRRSLMSFRDQMRAAEAKSVGDAYTKATNAVQNGVKTALGL